MAIDHSLRAEFNFQSGIETGRELVDVNDCGLD